MSLGVSPFQIQTLKANIANIIAITNAVCAAPNRFGTDSFRSVVDVVGDSTETPYENVLALDLKLAIDKGHSRQQILAKHAAIKQLFYTRRQPPLLRAVE